jgi:competence protein ComEA
MQAIIKWALVAAVTAIIASVVVSCRRNKQSTRQDDATSFIASAGSTQRSEASDQPCIDLNSATAEELMRLPGVGKVTAAKIIEFRERHGPFRRPQDIIIIHGLSERKYRKLAEFVCAR